MKPVLHPDSHITVLADLADTDAPVVIQALLIAIPADPQAAHGSQYPLVHLKDLAQVPNEDRAELAETFGDMVTFLRLMKSQSIDLGLPVEQMLPRMTFVPDGQRTATLRLTVVEGDREVRLPDVQVDLEAASEQQRQHDSRPTLRH